MLYGVQLHIAQRSLHYLTTAAASGTVAGQARYTWQWQGCILRMGDGACTATLTLKQDNAFLCLQQSATMCDHMLGHLRQMGSTSTAF